jgi:REP element-mobilizing transposase RayT
MNHHWTKVVYLTKYHPRWCRQYRRHVLTCDVERRVTECAHMVADDFTVTIFGLETMRDEVQLLSDIPRTVPPPPFMGRVKGRSSCVLTHDPARLHPPSGVVESLEVRLDGGWRST